MSSPDKPKHSPASPESRNGSLSCFSVPRACLFTPIRLHSPQSGRGISIKNTRGTVLMVGRDYGCGRSAELTRHFVPRGPWLAARCFVFDLKPWIRNTQLQLGNVGDFFVFSTLKIELRFRETETELASRGRDLNSGPEKQRWASEPDGLQSSPAASLRWAHKWTIIWILQSSCFVW